MNKYDIYGGHLRRGHCEVHPWVHEYYPCSVCHSESTNTKVEDPERVFQKWSEEKHLEFYVQQERKYYESLAREKSRMYRIVDLLATIIGRTNDAIMKYREKILKEVVQQ
jgi:hypothetical protein